MAKFDPGSVIQDVAALRALYDKPLARSLKKELDHLSPLYQAFIEHTPFVVIASVGPRGVDISPRGDAPASRPNKSLLTEGGTPVRDLR